jgi:hypothetical protein
MKIKTYAKVIDGLLIRSEADSEKIRKFFSDNEGKEIIEQRKTAEEFRSDAQNRLFHGILLPAMQRTMIIMNHERAYDKEYIKERICKGAFLKVHEGTPDEYVRSTSSLSVREFWELCQKVFVLIESMGGELNETEREEWERMIVKFKLDTHILDAMSRTVL